MPAINAYELGRLYKLNGPRATVKHLSEALRDGHLAPNDFSLRDLAENLVPNGREWVHMMRPAGGYEIVETDAVDSTAFSNITGQIIYNALLDGYQSEEFVCSSLMQTFPTRFDGEKIAGIGRILDEVESVPEGMPFPHLGFGEDYIDTPSTTKRGLIVPVTKEAVFFDRTNLVINRAREVGQTLGINKEKRCADLITGVTNNHNWKGSAYNTYVSTPWDNTMTDELIDWTDIDQAEQLFADILDPNTSEPIVIGTTGMTLLTMPAYHNRARYIVGSAMVEAQDTAATVTQTHHGMNPIGGKGYRAVQSRFAYRRLINSGLSAAVSKKYWFFGEFNKAFAYMENWPITVVQAPTNSEAEFTEDIILRFKASERGVAAVINPRFVVQSTGAS